MGLLLCTDASGRDRIPYVVERRCRAPRGRRLLRVGVPAHRLRRRAARTSAAGRALGVVERLDMAQEGAELLQADVLRVGGVHLPEYPLDLREPLVVALDRVLRRRREVAPERPLVPHREARHRHDGRGDLQDRGGDDQESHDDERQRHHNDPVLEV